MKTDILRGKTALITGASSGLGTDFARELAARGCRLVLVARREDRLLQVQRELSARYGVAVQCEPMDLTASDAPQQLYDRLQREGLTVDVLVNNAGFGVYGEYWTVPWERVHQMLQLDVVSLTHLTQLFVADMVARNFGYVLQVASTGAFQPTPTYAAYAAAKAYVLNMGEALHYELRQTAVECTVLCPGATQTEFLEVAGQETNDLIRLTSMKSSAVAKIGIESMLRGRSCVVAGRLNAFFALATRLLPHQLQAAMAYRLVR